MKKINLFLQGAMIIALFSVLTPAHFANAAWNNNVYGTDCATTMVLNYTAGTTKTNYCYPTSVSANQGDTVNAVIYYRNTSASTAHNVVVHLSPSTFSASTNQTFTGSITSSDNGSVSTSASINIPTAQSLTYGSVQWYQDQSYGASSLLSGQNGSEIFSSGLNIGDIPGYSDCPVSGGVKNVFCHQGWIYVSFNVSSTVITPACTLSLSTPSSVTIPYNSNTTISWNAPNCTSVTVNGIPQYSNSFTTPALTSPNYTYTVLASDSFGHNPSQSVYVTVTPQVSTCTLSLSTPSSVTIPYNSNTTISWNANNCTSVAVNGISQNSNGYGSYTTPTLTYSQNYSITASGNGGSAPTQNVYVTVTPQNNTTCTLSLITPTTVTIPYNSNTTISWNATNCNTVSVNGIPQALYNNSYTTPTLTYNQTYIISASDSFGHNPSQSVYVNVGTQNNTTCYINSFTANGSYGSATISSGGTATLNWTTTGCTTISLTTDSLVAVSSLGYGYIPPVNGNTTVGPLYNTTRYILTASSATGQQSAPQYVTITVNGYYPPNPTPTYCSITNFSGPTYPVSYGGTAIISWNTTGCNSVAVSGPGIYSTLSSGSQTTSALYGTSNYVLTATDYSGYQQTRNVSITTNSYPNPTPVPTVSNPITTIATNITTTSARLNGIIPQSSNSASINAYFEYGTSYSLGSQTNTQTVSTYTLMNYYDTISTTPNTVYYYRAVENTNGNITRGDIVSFTTPSTDIVPVVVNRITYGTGSGSVAASLTVTDQFQTVNSGDLINYTITYKNLSSQTLSNVALNFILPTGVTYKFASQGTITTNNTVLVSLGNLDKGATGTVMIEASVDNSVVTGSTLVATATLSFTNTSGAQDSAVAYVLNSVSGNSNNNSNLAGLALFGGNFFPTTLLGWIILIGIIIILVLITRKYNDERKAKLKTKPSNINVDSHDNVYH